MGRVKEIKPCLPTARVYDFSVPGHENFVAGNGVCSHNTYGERMRLDDGRVLPNFVGQALRGEPLTVYGEGQQTRSFCYVSDLVDGIYRLLHADYHLPVNLGNPSEITILEFAEEILKLTGSKSTLVNKPLPPDDPRHAQAGHLAGAEAARVGAEGGPRGGAAADDRVFQGAGAGINPFERQGVSGTRAGFRGERPAVPGTGSESSAS